MGVLPRKILKTKKAGEAISGHFAGVILPKVNEDFRGKCSSLMYALFKYKILIDRHNMSVLDLGVDTTFIMLQPKGL